MKMIKGLFVLILIGFIFSGANYPNSKIFALEAGGGGGGSGGFDAGGGGGIGAGGAIGIAGLAISAVKMFKTNCGMGDGPTNFGGRITTICKCKDKGMILKISSPRGGNYYFGKGSIAYLYGTPKPSVWTVGMAGGKKVCFDLMKKPKPMSGSRIIMIGTSLF